ncbi:Proteasome subunit beta type-6 [Coemansia sp. RSA 1939]|nr:Proteasome subunit beta type-6 [Coemansia sp. RSA 1939]KAJ2614816.1 Proteasome subunit beta type-6 [Coemansia sp. RSA 1804]
MEYGLMHQEPNQHPVAAPREVHNHGFYPYVDNGGTVLGICGKDFALVASDTRQSNGGYLINSRDTPKTFKLSNGTVLGSAGFHADTMQCLETLEQRAQLYFHKHERQMNAKAMAQTLSHLLYSKRFFPYMINTVLAGVDAEGNGVLYSYDPVGSFGKVTQYSHGSASALLNPFLDNQIARAHQAGVDHSALPSREQAIKLAIDAFTSATERDIYTGDWLEILVVDSEGVQEIKRELKHD